MARELTSEERIFDEAEERLAACEGFTASSARTLMDLLRLKDGTVKSTDVLSSLADLEDGDDEDS
jgi:hypothetical protein